MGLSLLLVLAASSFALDDSCQRWEKEFSQSYSAVKRDCKEHSDCVVGYYDWDPCVAQAVAKEQTFQDYAQARSALHDVCGYVVKPCAAVIEQVYCLGRRCALHSDASRRFPAYRFLVPRLKDGEVALLRDTGIRCVTTPCPSTEEVFRTKIEGHRFSVPNRFFLGEEGREDSWFVIGGAMVRVDANAWTKEIAGVITIDAAPAGTADAGQGKARVGDRARYTVPPGWEAEETASDADPAVTLSKGQDAIKIRLLGGPGSRYAGPREFLEGFEARTMGRPAEDLGLVAVAGVKTRLYRAGVPIMLGDPHVRDPRPPQLAWTQFCVLPSGDRFIVLSWTLESPVPDPEAAGEKAWRRFLSAFELKGGL
ncbi:MAG: hypothetical protein HY927_11910 [Elusimicrobia bacterium]|nr:hypothetical protein [Elusimicrobiota bacterium]